MKIKIFLASASSIVERQILQCFGAGAEAWARSNDQHIDISRVTRIGRWEQFDVIPQNTIEYIYQEAYDPCDVAVIFGSWKPREKGTHVTRNNVAQNAQRFVVIETPLLNRKTDRENTYWRVGINGYLSQDAFWPQLDKAQAKQRLEDLGIEWNDWKNCIDGHILVALQLPGDASLRGIDINDWAYHSIIEIRRWTDRLIVVRNHPLCSQRAFADHNDLARRLLLNGVDRIRFSDGQTVPWKEDLEGAYCTVTFTSGLAIDSILAGIPTVACDAGNFAYGISTNHLHEINRINMPDKEIIDAWLRSLSGCQWNLQEMRDGTCWHHILPVLEKI